MSRFKLHRTSFVKLHETENQSNNILPKDKQKPVCQKAKVIHAIFTYIQKSKCKIHESWNHKFQNPVDFNIQNPLTNTVTKKY